MATWLFETKKPECILISINMAIAWTTETAKFRKLKEWQHFEDKILIFLVLYVFWVVKRKKKIEKASDFEIHAIKVHAMKISSKFQVNLSTKTWDIPSASLKTVYGFRKTHSKFLLLVVQKYSYLQSIEQYKKIKYYKIIII